jgi:hypothetical protein
MISTLSDQITAHQPPRTRMERRLLGRLQGAVSLTASALRPAYRGSRPLAVLDGTEPPAHDATRGVVVPALNSA